MKSRSLLLLAALLLARPLHADGIDDFVRLQMERRHIPGMAIAVVSDREPERIGTYGTADFEWDRKVEPDTVFAIGPLSRQFTAAAAMLLVKDGTIRLDGRLDGVLSGVPPAWGSVTVRQLLSQTAGLPGYTDLPDFSRRSALPVTPEGLVASVAKEAFPFPPGTRFADSSTAWCLLGMIVENVSGRRFADFFDRRIGMPAGLTTTRLDAAGDVVPRRARGYERKGEEFRQPAFQHPTWAFAGDGVLSTIRDLARWAVVLRDGSFLPRTSLDTMWTQVSLTGGGRFPFGLGWNVGSYRGRKAVWLAGEGRGFSSATLVFPTDGLTIVVLTNGAASGPLRIARGIASFVDPGLPFVERIGTRPDTEPARAERIRGALQEVESSPADVRFLTPGLAAALTPAQRSLAAALSRARRVLGLVTSDRPAPGLDVYGSKIAQICTYRYELQDGSGLDANLWLTAEGRVAWMETETDQ